MTDKILTLIFYCHDAIDNNLRDLAIEYYNEASHLILSHYNEDHYLYRELDEIESILF